MVRRRDHITVNVDISDAEVDIDVDDLCDGAIRTIIEEANRRGMFGHYDRDYAELAMEALLGKRYGEATALLDRALYPYPSPREAASLMKGLKQLPLEPDPKRPARGG